MRRFMMVLALDRETVEECLLWTLRLRANRQMLTPIQEEGSTLGEFQESQY